MNRRLADRPSRLTLLSLLLLGILIGAPAFGATQPSYLYLPLIIKPGPLPTATATTSPTATTTAAPATITPTEPATSTPTEPATAAPATITPTELATSTPTEPATAAPATITPTEPATNTPTATPPIGQVGITGQVAVMPMWKESTRSTIPVAYQIVLDVGSSMSYNFAGEGWLNGQGVQCEVMDNNYDPTLYRFPFSFDCYGGASGYWNVESERRISIAKQALLGLIDSIAANDTMQIIKLTSDGNGPVDVNGDGLGNAQDWSSDKARLRNGVLRAGRYNNDPYLTAGDASTPQALQTAAQMWQSNGAPGSNYQPVSILLTDSVANIFINGRQNDAEDSCPDIYNTIPNQQMARAIIAHAPRCHLGFSQWYSMERPITSAISIMDAAKRANASLAVYVVALAGVNATGLEQISSSPNMFYTAPSPELVQSVLEAIRMDTSTAECITHVDPWINQIDAAHTPVTPYPTGTYGYVELYDQAGQPLPGSQGQLPIRHDPRSGQLAFQLPLQDGLPPGTYQLAGVVGYRGNDGATRQYDRLYDPQTGGSLTSRAFTITEDAAGTTVTLDPVRLQLSVTDLCP